MNIIKLEGTYNEIGKQHGQLLKGFFKPPPASDTKKKFTEKCIKLMEEYTPDIIDEVEGLAEASETDPKLMKSFIFTLGLDPGCTVFALAGTKNSENTPIFARNYDWDQSFLEYFIAVKTIPKQGHRNLSFSDHMVGRYGGINEKGLAVAITAIPAYNGKAKPGIRMNIAVRWILDKMSKTKEAVEWLTNIPHQWAHNYLIADAEGTLARVESNPINTVSITSNEFVASTNHYHDKMMKRYESAEFDFSNTHRRYSTVDKWYRENDSFSLVDVEKMLQGHDDGVCNHGEGYETIWSWYAPLGTGVAYVCHGNPCKGNFERIEY
jgi:predicted choloylglycine hydrolase